MWKCPNCGEALEDSFEVCWRCGTNADGTADPGFKRAMEGKFADAELRLGPKPDPVHVPPPVMRGQYWLIVAASVIFLWFEFEEGVWTNDSSFALPGAFYLLRGFVLYAVFVVLVFAHALLRNKNRTRP